MLLSRSGPQERLAPESHIRPFVRPSQKRHKTVSKAERTAGRVSTHLLCLYGIGPDCGLRDRIELELSVLDIVYVLVAIAVFAVIGVVAWGVEKL